MKRKLMLIVMGFFGLMFSLYIAYKITGNLSYYSVYYARHMPHDKSEHPELSLALRNLNIIEKPGNFQYHIRDRGRLVYIGDYLFTISDPGFSGNISIKKRINLRNDDSYIIYHISHFGKVLYHEQVINGNHTDDYTLTSQEEAESIRILQETLDPVMKVQPTEPPSLNLQWLFNYVNKR